MPVTRKFIDWNQPALPAVADYLITEYAVLNSVDLTNVIVVLPGRRAGRRLLELLAEVSEKRSLILTPPDIETVGRLPELLYENKRQFATDLENKLAWMHALRGANYSQLKYLIPELPKPDDTSRWLSLADTVFKRHRELAAEGLSFLDVAENGHKVKAFSQTEERRWNVMHQVQESCLRILDELELWDRQEARLFAIKHEECQTSFDIVLAGTVDMNRATCLMLDQRGVTSRVTSLIHAPESEKKRFDKYGCLRPNAWTESILDLDDNQVEVVDGPEDQAEAVVHALSAFGGRYRADEITIGMADESLVPQVQRQLTHQKVASRWVVGMAMSESMPFQLLKSVSAWLESSRFEFFAAFIRHADINRWITGRLFDNRDNQFPDEWIAKGSWLRNVDDYFNEFLPPELGEWIEDEIPPGQTEDTISASRKRRLRRVRTVRAVYNLVKKLLRELTGNPRSLKEWSDPIRELLLEVYADVDFNLDNQFDVATLNACRAIHDTLVLQAAIPDSLSPVISATRALQITLDQISGDGIPSEPDDEAIELLGWLELPLDDAPALIVTTFNDGFVPKSQNSDLFLPNALREHLKLTDNRQRYARDAYAMHVLLQSRRDIKFIVARRDHRGDPLRPSRLLFAAEPQEIAKRVMTCFGDQKPRPRVLPFGDVADFMDDIVSPFKIPRPIPGLTVKKIGVTSFRTFLACPYRFYLRHVLHLRSINDNSRELDALKFGILMHEVLMHFGKSQSRDSTNAGKIREFLDYSLDKTVKEFFGTRRMPAVNVQVKQLQQRLHAFADWQAQWRDQGWRIFRTESSFAKEDIGLEIADGRSLALDGRVDRIDEHEDGNHYFIFDYKSSENGRSPEATHRNYQKEWLDLQLPLYHMLLEAVGVTGQIDLGYIVLPKDTEGVFERAAKWTDSDLDDAHQVALGVAEKVLNAEFWPPRDPPPDYFEEYSAICQDTVFDREAIES